MEDIRKWHGRVIHGLPRVAPIPPELRVRLELLRGACFCVLYDLSCWLAGAAQPVPATTSEYRFVDLRREPDPRRRLGRYCASGLLEIWDAVLGPFFATGFRLAPAMGDSARLREDGLEHGDLIRAELLFATQSRLLMLGVPAVPLPVAEWVLTCHVTLASTAARIEDATLRPVPGKEIPVPESAAPVDPLAMLSAAPAARPGGDLPGPSTILPNPLVGGR